MCVSTRRRNLFPSVLLQPLGHLSVFRISSLQVFSKALLHTPSASVRGDLDPPVTSATCGEQRTAIGRILCKTCGSARITYGYPGTVSARYRGPPSRRCGDSGFQLVRGRASRRGLALFFVRV